MATTAQQWQAKILEEVGANLADIKGRQPLLADISANVTIYWDMWEGKSYAPYLQYLYTRIAVLDSLIGQLRNLTDANLAALNPRLGQKVDRLLAIRREWELDIERWEVKLRAGATGVVGMITTKEILSPPTGALNPSDPRYRGDALSRT